MVSVFEWLERWVLVLRPGWKIVLILRTVRKTPRARRGEPTFAAANPSFPFNSASASYPIGASSLYGPAFAVNLTFDTSLTGKVVVSVADGAILISYVSQVNNFGSSKCHFSWDIHFSIYSFKAKHAIASSNPMIISTPPSYIYSRYQAH